MKYRYTRDDGREELPSDKPGELTKHLYRTYPFTQRAPEPVHEFMDRKRAQWALEQPEVTE